MKRRPKLPTIYDAVSDFDGAGVKYIAHLIDQNGKAYPLGPETVGQGNQNQAANHPDQSFWGGNRNTIKKALEKAEGSISRIEIDCTLLPCGAQYTGCLYRAPLLIKEHFQALRNTRGFNLLNNIDPGKIPLRVFSHRMENQPIKVIFCLSGDSRDDLTTAYDNSEEWLWVEYKDKYLGPQITVDERNFSPTPNLA
jgi:hypothetical protein